MSQSNLDSTAIKFFDFYAMYELYLRAGGFRNHGYDSYPVYVNESIWNKIVYKYENVVDEFYSMVKRALLDSLQGEVRHFPSRCYNYNPNVAPKFYDNIKKRSGVTEEMISKAKQNVEAHPEVVHVMFSLPKWHCSYGGKAWARAAKMLIEAKQVNTHHDKVFWCDRVLDLQHNTGHLLDKTDFECLSSPCIAIMSKSSGLYTYHKPLNFRAKARSIKAFLPYLSSPVAKLVIPRMRILDPIPA